ncbi:MAG: hypothetical protein ABIA56_02560 [Actinomycetota bacterium]
MRKDSLPWRRKEYILLFTEKLAQMTPDEMIEDHHCREEMRKLLARQLPIVGKVLVQLYVTRQIYDVMYTILGLME